MPVHHLAAAARQHRDLKAIFPDRGDHTVNGGVILARIACIEHQAVDAPTLDLWSLRQRGCHWLTSSLPDGNVRSTSSGLQPSFLASRRLMAISIASRRLSPSAIGSIRRYSPCGSAWLLVGVF